MTATHRGVDSYTLLAPAKPAVFIKRNAR